MIIIDFNNSVKKVICIYNVKDTDLNIFINIVNYNNKYYTTI